VFGLSLNLSESLRTLLQKGRDLSYQEGFEDAIELCLAESEDCLSKEAALEKMRDLLVLVKEQKFDRLKRMLGQLSK
jgi:hypothetical protein